MKKITILVVDDHDLVGVAWSAFLNTIPEFLVVGTSASGEDAVKRAGELKPAIVLMDITMGDMNGIIATSLIRKESPASAVLALSVHKSTVIVKQMIKAGARGYVTKDSTPAELVEAIHKIYAGGKYICKAAVNEYWESLQHETGIEKLSKRENQVLEYVVKGKTSKDISQLIGASYKTVEAHRHHILKKLKLKNSIDLVNFLNNRQVQLEIG